MTYTRLQFTLPNEDREGIFNKLSTIVPPDKGFMGTTDAPTRGDSFLLIVIINDPEIECMLKLKFSGYETFTRRL